MDTSTAIIATITDKTVDLLYVQIETEEYNEQFEYSICDPANNMIRRGIFKGPAVQIRTSLLKDGRYRFYLYNKTGDVCFVSSFIKE